MKKNAKYMIAAVAIVVLGFVCTPIALYIVDFGVREIVKYIAGIVMYLIGSPITESAASVIAEKTMPVIGYVISAIFIIRVVYATYTEIKKSDEKEGEES